jgi:hypothetical protein
MNVFYVYVYLDPRKPGEYVYGEYKFDYEPIYVGKGKGYRYIKHLSSDRNNILKTNKIDKILREGFEPKIVKVVEDVSNDESLKIEIELIKLIGRYCKGEGTLTNVKPGGENPIEYEHTQEYKETLYKPVVMYDLDGNVLGTYKSMKEASEVNNIPNKVIGKICSGDIKIYKNKYIFCYKDVEFVKRVRLKREYSIIRIDYLGNIKEYISITEAALDNKTTLGRINSVCMGNRFQTCGYLFRYKSHPKLELYNNEIEKKYSIYLNVLDKEIIYKSINYVNILHAIYSNGRHGRVNNIYNQNFNI